MYILYLLAYWYTYSKWYILGSWFITHILNIAFKKLWLSPLLINAVALIVLALGIYFKMIQGKEVGASVLNYTTYVTYVVKLLVLKKYVNKKKLKSPITSVTGLLFFIFNAILMPYT